MRSAVFVSLAALAVAQMDSNNDSTSVPPYSNPNTMYLSQTNSRGVVTGQPTTFPVLATDLPAVATSPAGANYPGDSMGGSMYGNPRSTGGSGGMMMSGTPAMPTGSAMASGGSMSMGGGAMASNSMGSGGMMGGGSPTPSSGGMGGETPGSGSGGSTPTSSSSGSSESTGAASPAFQVSSGLLGVVGLVFAAFL